MKNLLKVFAFPIFALSACASNPVNAVPVTEFEPDRYLGTWYEIARLDHSFERGMTNVTANYTLRDDSNITVSNRGFVEKKNEFKDAKGKAKFFNDRKTGHLKVSFFGPFYGDYIIFELDQTDYDYAFVSGGNDKYLWLLARTPEISESVRNKFLEKSAALGYETKNLIWVSHNRAQVN